MHTVALAKKQFGKIRAVLPSHARDESNFVCENCIVTPFMLLPLDGDTCLSCAGLGWLKISENGTKARQ